MHLKTVLAILLLASVACSSPDRGRGALPAGPSAAAVDATPMGVGGISGPMDVLFPSRADAFQFRNELEVKYQTGLNRAPSSTYVDREGEVVWVQEYLRYRVNGCDHATAQQRVMTQIDGGTPGGICAENREFVVQFPPRNETMEFRRALEAKYQSMGRSLQSTYVDPEGSVIWTQEYMRYRVNECDHAAAVQKVFQQIDGGEVAATCVPNCRYRVAPSDRDLSEAQQSSFVDIIGEPGGCAWTAASDAPWLTFDAAYNAGNNGVTIPYTVTQNVSGGPRLGRIRVLYGTNSFTTHTVYQAGNTLITTFTMADTFRSGSSPTTECHLRSTATPCTFTATSNLPGGGAYTYVWTANYFYGTATKTVTQTGTSNQFTVTDACNASDATTSGTAADLDVTLQVTDSAGNTQTIRSGQGTQPALRIVKFTC